jgi:heme/copper-type cytochrome/quinol oxidase subunit 2
MEIFVYIAAAVVAIMTGISIYLVYRKKQKLTLLPGIIISSAIAIMAGLLSGSMMGILANDLFLPVGIGLLIGFFTGFLAGQSIGILAILSSTVSGLMSGIVGAILGAFIQFDNPAIMLGILLGLCIVMLGLVILYLLVEPNPKFSINTNEISPFTIFSAGILLISLFLFLYSSDLVKTPGTQTESTNRASLENVEIDVTNETSPVVKMMITPTGYSPNVIRVKKGVPVELEITNPTDNSCFSEFMMPDFSLNNVPIKTGTTKLTFTPDKIGEFTFHCGMNMYRGTVIVE